MALLFPSEDKGFRGFKKADPHWWFRLLKTVDYKKKKSRWKNCGVDPIGSLRACFQEINSFRFLKIFQQLKKNIKWLEVTSNIMLPMRLVFTTGLEIIL